jgi:hypothetical protein
MDTFFAAVRRTIRLDGEAALGRAVAGLEKAKTRLYAAAFDIQDEKFRQVDAQARASQKFYEKKAKSEVRVATLRASFERAVRVADRIAGLVE